MLHDYRYAREAKMFRGKRFDVARAIMKRDDGACAINDESSR